MTGPHPARRRAAHRRRRRPRAAVGRQGRGRDRGARPVGHRRATTASRRPRSSTTAGCAPATSAPSSRSGFIRITDRAKDVIKSGGEWISSVALENLLMAHPAVAEAAVIGVPDDKWGERPLACVVRKPGQRGRQRRAARAPRRTRSRAGGCPSAGPSSTRCRRRASASSTRRCCARATPAASCRSRRDSDCATPLARRGRAVRGAG